jgi:cell division protein FtsL
MGQPARRIQASQTTLRTPRLRLVDTPPARAPRPPARASARTRARAEEARARSLFTAFALVFLCAVALGGARLSLTTRAAEYSLSENRLLADIRQQRVAVDQLEVDRSALSTPSRIAGIASSTMSMGEPRSVNYIAASDIAPAGEPAEASGVPVSTAGMSSAPGIFERVVQAVVELSAGEAQSLLVGDLGLAGSR